MARTTFEISNPETIVSVSILLLLSQVMVNGLTDVSFVTHIRSALSSIALSTPPRRNLSSPLFPRFQDRIRVDSFRFETRMVIRKATARMDIRVEIVAETILT